MNEMIYNFVSDILKQNKEVVFIGIGTPNSYLDSIGPRIGTELSKHYPLVYGTVKEPAHALSLETIYYQVIEKHPDAYIIAIDAMISSNLGKISVCEGPIKPGAGLGKQLIKIGSHSIKIATVERGQECYLRDKILNLSSEAIELRNNLETNVSVVSRAIIQALKDNKNII